MTRRGTTLIEILMAIALLSGLTIACVSWTTAMSRTLSSEGGRAAWRSDAARSLDLLDDWLRTEDRSPAERDRWRLQLADNHLDIRTREIVEDADERPSVCALVRLRVQDHVLLAEFLDDNRQPLTSRSLISHVSALEARTDTMEDKSVRITVAIAHESGTTVARTWRLPREHVR